jgi:hypothetical protein
MLQYLRNDMTSMGNRVRNGTPTLNNYQSIVKIYTPVKSGSGCFWLEIRFGRQSYVIVKYFIFQFYIVIVYEGNSMCTDRADKGMVLEPCQQGRHKLVCICTYLVTLSELEGVMLLLI